MKFTKGLFLGTALGISAAMMMNNKSANKSMSNNTNSDHFSENSMEVSGQNKVQSDDYIGNDII